MLINTSYFFGDIQIGQLSEQSVQDTLTLFIKQYEPRFLERLLGYETYKNIESGVDAKWTELKNGVEYTFEDRLYKWQGLVNATTLVSPIAYYVYCQYMENQLTATGGAGEGKVKMQNAIPVSSGRKIRKAWNLMVEQNRMLYHFLAAKYDVYTEWYQWKAGRIPAQLFTEANSLGI